MDAVGGRPITGRVRIKDRSYALSSLANLQRGKANLRDILGGATFQKPITPGITLEAIGSVSAVLDGHARANFVDGSRPRVNTTDRAGWRTGVTSLTARNADRARILGQKLVVGIDCNVYVMANTTTAPVDWQNATAGSFVKRAGAGPRPGLCSSRTAGRSAAA